MTESLIALLFWATALVLAYAMFSWRARRRSPMSFEAIEEGRLIYHELRRDTAISFGGIMTIVAVFSVVPLDGTRDNWIALMAVILALHSGWTVIAYYRQRHDISEAGMVFRSVIGSPRRFAWTDIVHIRYSRLRDAVVLGLKSGKTIRVSKVMRGIPDFASCLLRYSGSADKDAATEQALRNLAAGNVIPTKVKAHGGSAA